MASGSTLTLDMTLPIGMDRSTKTEMLSRKIVLISSIVFPASFSFFSHASNWLGVQLNT
jgi:hypothetical protein